MCILMGMARAWRMHTQVLDTSECEIGGYWCASSAPLCAVAARASGTIEDAGEQYLQLDFANRVVGGGVLRNGCVQAELREPPSPSPTFPRLPPPRLRAGGDPLPPLA